MPTVLAIDLGGTKALSAVVDGDGQILGRGRTKIGTRGNWESIRQNVLSAVEAALGSAGLALDDLAGCGIGVPGPTDFERGIAHILPNLGLTDVHVGADLGAALGKPVYVENDVNAGLMGEVWRGAARGLRHVAGMFPGTGLGGAVLIDGRILRGKTGITGEIGHMVMNPKGPLCGCGRAGCLEAYASRTAMQAWAEAKMAGGEKSALAELLQRKGGRIGSRAFQKAAEMQDSLALRAINRVARYLGYAAANLIHLLSPERIVLGGGVIEALGPYMMDLVRQVAQERCLPGCYDGIEIVQAACGDDAGILGVAGVTLQALGYDVISQAPA